jgi:hypothetical protein
MIAMAGSKNTAGVRKCIQTLRTGFSGGEYSCGSPPLDLAAPSFATILLHVGVVLPPLGRLDANVQLDAGRAPYLSVSSRLSAASSNTRVSPPVPSSPPHTLEDTCPIP